MLTKITFNSVFRQAWYESVMPANITSGFRKAGVFPFDRNAVKVIDYIMDYTGECDHDDNASGEIIQVHENACPSKLLSPSLSLSLSTFRNLVWMFLIGYKGNEDPLGDDDLGMTLVVVHWKMM